VAATLAETVSLLSAVLFQATLHRIGAADEAEARRLTEKGCRMSVLAMLGGAAVSVPAVWIGLPVLWGEDFAAGPAVFSILMIGYVLMGVSPIATYFAVHKGQPLATTVFALVGPLVSLPAYWQLTPSYGIEGAAAAATLGYLTVVAVMAGWYRFRTGCRLAALFVPTAQEFADVAQEAARAVRSIRERLG
jgi:O-antigen/teichoic acid export membrane protein